jgi:hypothetical protein
VIIINIFILLCRKEEDFICKYRIKPIYLVLGKHDYKLLILYYTDICKQYISGVSEFNGIPIIVDSSRKEGDIVFLGDNEFEMYQR